MFRDSEICLCHDDSGGGGSDDGDGDKNIAAGIATEFDKSELEGHRVVQLVLTPIQNEGHEVDFFF